VPLKRVQAIDRIGDSYSEAATVQQNSRRADSRGG
jgi:hypothetical protein